MSPAHNPGSHTLNAQVSYPSLEAPLWALYRNGKCSRPGDLPIQCPDYKKLLRGPSKEASGQGWLGLRLVFFPPSSPPLGV